MIIKLAQTVTREMNHDWDKRLETILTYCVQSPLQTAFPKIRSLDIAVNQYTYLQRYLKRYYDARAKILLFRTVSTIPDPAVDVVIKSYLGARNLEVISAHHRQVMGAENLLGELLERYIASRLEPKGWIWCAGNTIRSVDFLTRDMKVALQVKNRDNSENSSSSAVRVGTKIQKWFRIFSKSGKTNWNRFPLADELSEDDFQAYIKQYALGVK